MGRLYPFPLLLALTHGAIYGQLEVKRTCASINVNDGLNIDIKASVAQPFRYVVVYLTKISGIKIIVVIQQMRVVPPPQLHC